MAYTNSPLVVYTKLSPNHSGQRTHSIDRITPHCVVGQLSAESICGCFISPGRQASCNYGIGYDGRVSLCVEEKNRSWCTSSRENDQRAITIECASDSKHPYAFKDVVYNRLVELCIDICKRNGKSKLLWLGDKDKTLNYTPKSDEMVLTVHRWYANKSCPGDWMYARMGDLASKVTAALNTGADTTPPETDNSQNDDKYTGTATVWYRVRKRWDDAQSQKGAFHDLKLAKKCADSNPGYSVFDESGKAVYTSDSGSTPAPTTSLPYKVRVRIDDLNIRKGPGTNYASRGYTGKGIFTIVEEADGQGATRWGLLKGYQSNRSGWVSLDYTAKL